MSSQKTKNLNLHSWEGEDKFLRVEMNENFATLDSAITEVKSTAASDLAAAKTALSGEISSASATLDGKLNSYAATAQTNLNSVKSSLTSSINSVSQALNDHIVLGTYAGDGNETQTIKLGFTPRAVFIARTTGHINTAYLAYGGLALKSSPTVGISIITNGFCVAYNTDVPAANLAPVTNDAGYSYNYIALR